MVPLYRRFATFKFRRLNEQESKVYSHESPHDINLLRNVGIIAHIDAGKTTTTERMLYYAGCIAHPGEVHDGNTKMDYLEQERARGITIRAATISMAWDNHHINIIDTPGHVDFSAEVERSLRVLDGAVVIFDGVQGVEPQSETVWEQANKFKLPRICFVNKMDRPGASMKFTAQSIQKALNVKPLMLNLPVGEERNFNSIIHLPSLKLYEWTDQMGLYVNTTPLQKTHPLYPVAVEEREKLIASLGEYDDSMAERYLSGGPVTEQEIDAAIRSALKNMQCTVLLAGSALKNRGIQPLLEGIIKYLPSPLGRGAIEGTVRGRKVLRKPKAKEKLCAYAFKVIHDDVCGPVSFVRTYSGTLKNKANLFNATTKKSQKVTVLARMLADELTHINAISAGDIAAVVGCTHIRSGDTLIEDGDKEIITLEGVDKPEAMFVCSVDTREKKDEGKMLKALEMMSREDPSITVGKNEETGQIFVSAMGELQLEVLRDRVAIEHKVRMKYGKLRVAYRESILDRVAQKLTFDRAHAGKQVFAELELLVEPVENPKSETANELIFDIKNKGYKESVIINHEDPKYAGITASTEIFRSLETMPEEYKSAVEEAVNNSLLAGKLLGYKMVGVRVTLQGGRWSNIRSTQAAFRLCGSELARQVLKDASPCLLEPQMDVSIVVPESCLADVVGDISSTRRGTVMSVDEFTLAKKGSAGDKKRVSAKIPLAEMSGYANFIRTASKGQGSYTMEFGHYEPVKGDRLKKILDNLFN